MEWDTRGWMLFAWCIAGIIFCCAFATPYELPGNRVNTIVAFGGNNIPLREKGAVRFGLWTEVAPEYETPMVIVQAMMCGALVFGVAIALGVNVALVRCGERRLVQIIMAVTLLLGAICAAVALLVFYMNMGQHNLNQGFWMTLGSGGIWLILAVCLFLMPILNDDPTLRKKHHIQEDGEAGVPLTKA